MAFTFNSKTIRESKKPRYLDEAIRIFEEVEKSLRTKDPGSKTII